MGEAHRYIVALGSNMRVPRIGAPGKVVRAAAARLDGDVGLVLAFSRIFRSAPLGPSLRNYANAALLLASELDPPSLLEVLQQIEDDFGRRRAGARWRARSLDLDIVLWSGGVWHSSTLTVPHPEFRQRAFVLDPAAEIAPHWRDPVSGLTLRQLAARLRRQGRRSRA